MSLVWIQHWRNPSQQILALQLWLQIPRLHLKAAHDVKTPYGEVAVFANVSDPGYAFKLSIVVLSVRLPKSNLSK